MTHKKPSSLTLQLCLLLLLAAAAGALLYCGLYFGGGTLLSRAAQDNEALQERTSQRAADFQNYVTKHQLAATDTDEITRWVKSQPLVLLELYRSDRLLYTSYAPEAVFDEEDSDSYRYDWVTYFEVTFSDGTAEALIWADETYQLTHNLMIAALLLAVALFLTIFLLGCRQIFQYILLLRDEIHSMEGGDLERPVTIRGDNELTQLAQSLEAMRLAFREQREEEAELYRSHRTMITQMSHDLRTPLTALQLYLDILRLEKYQPGQRSDCLRKMEQKTAQIRQMADHLFEYSLISRHQEILLEPPVPFRTVFHDLLSELVAHLSEREFLCHCQLDWPETRVQVYTPYLRRLLDNLSSNLLKYADPGEPILIQTAAGEGGAWLTVANRPRALQAPPEHNGIGLTNIKTMMEQMGGTLTVTQTEHYFRVKLWFPGAKGTAPAEAPPDLSPAPEG